MGGELTYLNRTLAESGANATSPKDGTVVRWRMVGQHSGGPFGLVVLRPVGGEKYEAVAAGALESPPDGSEALTFATSLPIRAGDTIGLNVPVGGSTTVSEAIAPTGSEFRIFFPELQPGDPPQALGGGSPNTEIGFNADVEYPDPAVLGPPPPGVPGCSLCGPQPHREEAEIGQEAAGEAGCKLGKVKKKGGATAKSGQGQEAEPEAGEISSAGVEGGCHPEALGSNGRRSPFPSTSSSARSAGLGSRSSCRARPPRSPARAAGRPASDG